MSLFFCLLAEDFAHTSLAIVDVVCSYYTWSHIYQYSVIYQFVNAVAAKVLILCQEFLELMLRILYLTFCLLDLVSKLWS